MCRKRSGFVLLVLALVLFSGLFVSAATVCDSDRLSIVNNTIKNGTQYASYNASLRANNISVLSCSSGTTAIVAGSAIVDCPAGVQNSFCVRSNTSSSSRVCTSYGLLGNCWSSTIRYSHKIAVYGVNVTSVTSGGLSSSVNCTQRCAVNRSASIGAPHISVSPSRCYFNGTCDSNVTINRGQNSAGYDLVWVYYYNDNTNNSICACNGSMVVAGKTVRVNSVADSYSLPIFINDSFGKMVDSVQLFVYSFNGTNRSSVNTGVVNIPVSYNCVSEDGCNVLGKKASYSSHEGPADQYITCVQLPGNTCYNWSEPVSCNAGSIFNESLQSCQQVAGLTVTCNGVDKFCAYLTDASEGNVWAYSRDVAVSLNHASERTDLRCTLPSDKCFMCAAGYVYDGVKGRCVKSSSSCVNNCTSSGGICGGVTISSAQDIIQLDVANAVVNTSLECCDDSLCHKCDSGFHVFNGTCISNNCSGVKPSGVGVFLGVNITTTGAVNWTYSPSVASLGACQWKCNESGYRLNISNNVSCIEGVANCSEFGGICSSTALVGGVLSIGNCSIGSCYVCNQNTNYFSNGTACVYQTCDSGKMWNGLSCVDPKLGCNGCVFNNKCFGNDTTRVVRVSAGANKYYCNSSSRQLVPLQQNNQSCQFGAQCVSNLCGANGKCLDVVEEVSKSSSMITTIYCWIINLGFGNNYDKCLLDNNVAANGS